MTTFVLIPGAGGQAWFWHRLVPELRSRGHTAIAVELPADDGSASLAAYADAVVRSIDVPGPVTVVAQSMGALVAPLVCDRLDVEQIVLVNAMAPAPGESGGDWWGATGQAEAARAYAEQQGLDPATLEDPWQLFFHDADPELLDEAQAAPESPQSGRPFEDPWPLPAAGRADPLPGCSRRPAVPAGLPAPRRRRAPRHRGRGDAGWAPERPHPAGRHRPVAH